MTTAVCASDRRRFAAVVGVAVAALLLAGCATTAPAGPGGPAVAATSPADPWQGWNRRVFAFNDALDEALLKPVAEGYRKLVPSLVRSGVDNVLGNIGDVWSTANQFLQGKLGHGLDMGMRVLTNTVFGLGGVLDPATSVGLVRRSEDFGQTLGRWGVGPGPYVVLPVLGPSTLRDSAALPVDWNASPSALPDTAGGRLSVALLGAVSTRANLLATTQLVDQAALDRYSFVRDGFLARRLDQVHDGAPPLQALEDDSADPSAPASAPGGQKK